jgi:glycosyltransferase involved in cell wall biosynthesis
MSRPSARESYGRIQASMKIAFVSQPIDSVLPPYQNSIGACTYGSACALSKSHQVIVYGSEFANGTEGTVSNDRNIQFCFVPSAPSDQLICKLRTRVSRIMALQPISTSYLYFPKYGSMVAQELRKERVDVIHIQHSSQYASPIRKLNPDAKIVLHLHAEWFSQSNGSQLLRRVESLNMLTAVSNYVSDKVARLLPSMGTPRATHYNGFDPSEFTRQKDYDALSRRREQRIMFAGGISPHKGIHVLFDAFKIIAERHPNARLLLLGPPGTYPVEETFDVRDQVMRRDLAPFYSRRFSPVRKLLSSGHTVIPDYVSELKSRLPAHLLDRITFFGKIPRSELIDHYYDADLFVFPSLFAEGFGLPPVEAMAAGTAVVASRSGAIEETVKHGSTGLLVNRNDAVALAAALSELLDDDCKRARFGRAGRQRAFQNFTWDHVTAKMEKAYLALMGN